VWNVEAGPAELVGQLPLRATTLSCMPGPDGSGEYWCARLDSPIKYHLPLDFDTARVQPEFLSQDDDGAFLWVHVLVVSGRGRGSRLHPGMKAFRVDVAYVVDLTLGDCSRLDLSKIDYVGIAVIDDLPEDQPGITAQDRSAEGSVTVAAPADVSAEEFRERLYGAVAQLATLAGAQPQQLPEPVRPGIPDSGGSAYEIGATALRYRNGGDDGMWLSTRDPDELLYWIVDDLAKDLALEWAQKAPAYEQLDDIGKRVSLWFPQWHNMMMALSPEWGDRTQARIDKLLAQDA
jgi:hypothetical protein